MSGASRWEFWIDRGGTFTDCLGRDPATGAMRVAKVLSSDRAPLEAIRAILGIGDEPLHHGADCRGGRRVYLPVMPSSENPHPHAARDLKSSEFTHPIP